MPSAQTLVNRYLSLMRQRANLDSQQSALEEEISAFCQERKVKTLRGTTHLIYLVRKLRTVFPTRRSPRRRELEALVASLPGHTDFSTLDIVKLASAYDSGKFTDKVKSLLKPFVVTKPFLKISLLPLTKPKK